MQDMRGRVNTRGPLIGHCNICDEFGPLTEDHVPPKGTLLLKQVELMRIVDLLGAGPIGKRRNRRYMPGGVHFRTLCAKCNNDLLGRCYDKELIRFSNAVSEVLRSSLALPRTIHVAANPGRLARAVVGHLLAIGVARRPDSPIWRLASEYFLDSTAPIPDGIDIYVWAYPHRTQVQIRFASLQPDFFLTKPILFSCLKYFPVGFMVAWSIDDRSRVPLVNLRDYMIHAGDHDVSIPIQLRPLVKERWPEAPHEEAAVFHTDDGFGAIPSAREKQLAGS